MLNWRRPSIAGLLGLCCLLAGCAATTQLTDTLPPAFEEQLEPIETDQGVALTFLPSADAERLEVNMGSIDLPLNRLFGGMLTEMALAKFGRIERRSENRLRVAVTYFNVEERSYMGTPVLSRVEMAIVAEAADGEREARQEFAYTAASDVDGYSVRSDQLYELLLRFVDSINTFVNENLSGP